MKKGPKIAGIVLGVIVLVFVALLVLAQVLITPERIRKTVLPRAQEALNGREVELGDIQVSFFSGIRLEDLRVSGRETEESFVAANRVVLRYQLLPLLFKRVVVDEIRLVDPVIRIERFSDGRFNFSDLVEKKKEEAPETLEPDEGGPTVDLLVSEVAIGNGELVFLDHAVGTEEPYRTKISGLQVRASDIALDENFPLTVEGMINDASLEVEGRIDPAGPGVQAEIVLNGLDVTAFAPYYREQLPGQLQALKVDLNLRLEGSAESAMSGGEVALKGIEILMPESEQPLKIELVRLDYNLQADLVRDLLQIDDTVLNVNGIPLQVSGKIENLTADQRLDMVVAVAELDLYDAVQAVPESLRQPAVDLEPAGAVELRFHLAGPVTAGPAALLKEGKIGLREVMVTVGEARFSLSGLLLLAGDSVVSENLVLRAGENMAKIDLKANNLFREPIVVENTVSAERFDLDALMTAAASPAAAAEPEDEDAPAAGAEVGPLDLPLQVDGSVRIGETVYQGLAMTDFVMIYRLAGNVLIIEKMGGNLAEGSFSQTAKIDLGVEGLAYQGTVRIDGVKAHSLISTFVPAATGTVFGTLNLDGSFSGRGTVSEALKRNLSARGDFSLLDGKLTGAGLVQELAGYLDLEELRVMQVSKAAGNLALQQGKVRIDGNFSGSDVRLAPQGTIGLDGNVDLALNARLSPELADRLGRGEVAKLLAGQEGWALLPIKVDGTWNSPKFALDTSALKRQAEEKVQQELRQKLQEKVFDKIAPPQKEGAEGEEEAQDPGKKLLDEALKGIFGN